MKWDEITEFSLSVCVGLCGGKVVTDCSDGGVLFDIITEPNSAEIIEELSSDFTLKRGSNWIVTGTYCRDFHDENGQSSSEFNNVKWELVK